MSPETIAVFAAALFVAAATPGPAITVLAARVVARGARGSFVFSAGLAVGDIVWLCAAILGLAALAQTFQAIFAALRWAGAAYLVYMAWKLWTAPPVAIAGDAAGGPPEAGARLFLSGLAVTLGNPKTMVFYLALLPTLVDLAAVTWTGLAELALTALAVLAVVFASYVAIAARARRLLRSGRAVRIVNRVAGVAMAGAAATIATR